MTIRPRRSLLYMPGSNNRALDKARSLPADGLILDMEDSVAPDAKAQIDAVMGSLRAGIIIMWSSGRVVNLTATVPGWTGTKPSSAIVRASSAWL